MGIRGPFPIVWMLMAALQFIAAADRPNFTGIWERDAGMSDPFTAVVAPMISSRRDWPGKNFSLRVNHRGKHLQIAVEQDGRKPAIATYDLGWGWHGNMNPEFGGSRYRSEWKGDTLAIERYVSYRSHDGGVRGNSYQEWVLSQGSGMLTITTTTSAVVTREVFRKK